MSILKSGPLTVVGAREGCKTFRISPDLRWRKPDNADPILQLINASRGNDGLILQQAWICVETGEVKWRDVPTE